MQRIPLHWLMQSLVGASSWTSPRMTIRKILSDAWSRYPSLLGAALVGSLTFSFFSHALPPQYQQMRFSGYSLELYLIGTSLICVGGWLYVAYYFGPTARGPAYLQWLSLQVKSDCQKIQLRFFYQMTAISSICAGFVFSSLSNLPQTHAVFLAATSFCAFLGSSYLALMLQRCDLDRVASMVLGPCLAAGVCIILASARMPGWLVFETIFVLLSAVAKAVFYCKSATKEKFRITSATFAPKWQLIRGHANRFTVTASVTQLDPAILSISQVYRHTTRSPQLEVFTRFPYFLKLSILSLTRPRGNLPYVLIIALPVPLAFNRLLGPAAENAAIVLFLFYVTLASTSSLENLLCGGHLRRYLPKGGRATFAALIFPCYAYVITFLGILRWHNAISEWQFGAALCLPVILLWRRHSIRSHQSTYEVLVATPIGAVPVHTFNRIIGGPDCLFLVLIFLNILE